MRWRQVRAGCAVMCAAMLVNGGCGLHDVGNSGVDEALVAAVVENVLNAQEATDGQADRPSAVAGGSLERVTPVDLLPGVGRLPKPSPFGHWLLEDGLLLDEVDTSLEAMAITVGEDGFGRVYFRDLRTGTNDCVRAFVLYDGEQMALDFSAEASLSFNPNRTVFFPLVIAGQDTLSLADEFGNIALLSRQEVLPDDVTCGELEVVDVISGLPRPNSFGDLNFFDGDLVFNSTDNLIEVFDLQTDTLIAPLGPTNSRFIQTTQPVSQTQHFWHHCGCGGSPDAFRSNLTTVFDSFHTGNNFNEEITIRAGAYVTDTDRLWLHGFGDNDNRGKFLVINPNVEPDVLEETIDFHRSVRGLTFDGDDLWGMVQMATRSIARIDAETGDVIETYELPDEDIFWTGLSFDEEFMYLIGSDASLTGVLYRLERP